MPERFALEVLQAGGVAEREVPLGGERTTIGRKPGNAIILSDTHVSGVHAEVVEEAGRWVLRDLGSTNGTFLDGRRIEEVTLSPGDEFVIGQTRMRFLDREAEPAAPAARRVEAPAPARRSMVLPLALLLALGGAGYAYFQFGRKGAREEAAPVAAVAGNLLRSPSFEAGDKDDPAQAWRSEEGGPRFAFGGRDGARSGGSGAYATFSGPGVARLVQAEEVAIDEGRSLLLALHARGEGSAIALRARFSSSHHPEVSHVRGGDFVQLGGSFARVEARVLPSAGCDRARLEAVVLGSSGTVVIDDLEMRAGESGRPEVLTVNEVECAFDPLDASLRRIREPWLRHLGVAFAAGGSRFVASEVLSPSTGEVRLPSGPAGRLVSSATAGKEGISIRYAFEPAGGAAARPALVFEIPSEYLAQNGVALLGPAGAPEYAGDFREESVSGLVLGDGQSRLRIGFDAPLSVAARLVSGGHLAVEAPFEKALGVTLQVSFEEERRRARDLVREASTAASPAVAIAKYGEVVSQFPFEKESLARAREERARLLREGLEKLEALEKEAEEARFFRLRGAFLSAKESATKLAEAYRGSEPGDRAAALLAKIEEDAGAYEAEVAAREKERRDRVAGELDRLGMKALAALVRGK